LIKDEIYTYLCEHADDYCKLRPRTGEADVQIMKAWCMGKSAIQIAMEMPCSEATVYRAIRRINQYLEDGPETDSMTGDDGNLLIHCSMLRGHKDLSLSAYKLYYILLWHNQRQREWVERKRVHSYLPGLNNKGQRQKAIDELNALVITTDEEPSQDIKIFDYVDYRDCKYYFRLTEEAAKYFE